MAGGPGSGKSTVINGLGLKEQGFKIVNQDISLEWLMKNHGLPTDMKDFTPEQAKHWTTSILYINSNNGYTKFETGASFESIGNRLVTFPANLKHTGSSCSDEKVKIVINFNYFT